MNFLHQEEEGEGGQEQENGEEGQEEGQEEEEQEIEPTESPINQTLADLNVTECQIVNTGISCRGVGLTYLPIFDNLDVTILDAAGVCVFVCLCIIVILL